MGSIRGLSVVSRLMCSIRGFLMLMLVVLLVLGAVVTIVWTRHYTSHEVEEVFDASLAQAAKVLHGLVVDHQEDNTLDELQESVYLAQLAGEGKAPRRGFDPDDPGHPYEYKVGFQVWSFDGKQLLSTPAEFPATVPDRPGFETLGPDDHRWRTYTLRDPKHRIWIRSGHRMSFRDELTNQIANRVLIPIVVVLPLLLLLLSLAIRRGLVPLDAISQELEQRRSDDLRPLPGKDLPAELVPVVQALNGLFERVGATLERERRFTADAAHELRTPLAALRIHLEKLRLAPEPSADLLRGIGRMERVVEQLLMLARIEPRRGQLPLEPVEMTPVCQDLVAELYPPALERDVQIEFEGEGEARVAGDETLLGIMLRNLIENAIRYTRRGDTLLLRLIRRDETVDIIVVDHGPGLDASEKQQVLQRFYRQHKGTADGAGLGLSIVALIVELHGGSLVLEDTPGGGLTVRVTLNRAPA